MRWRRVETARGKGTELGGRHFSLAVVTAEIPGIFGPGRCPEPHVYAGLGRTEESGASASFLRS